jgi:3-deoxy-D-manno-octulosonic-acid transferase
VTRPTFPLALYGAATGLLEPLAEAVLRARAQRGKEDAARLPERLGHPGAPRPEGALVWLHGVSVGESLSLLPLVKALRNGRPGLSVLVTSGTVTSAELLARRLPQGVIHQFAPVDAPGAVQRFLDHWRPDAALFAESEIWPNLLLGARARGVRTALVSARMTQESARGWARLPQSARALLSAFDLILPQDAATAERLQALGATVGPRLNLKLVGEPLGRDAAELARMRTAAGARKVVLAASTHPGEEPIIAAACPPGSLLVIAPRHPERGPELADRFGAPRRAAGEPPATGAVYVADTLGELGLWFALADVVVMGGSFVDGIGGHNPLEPARLGRPILTGPFVSNAADIYAELRLRVAALQAADEAALARHLAGLLENPQIARRMGEAALSYAASQSGALDAAMAALEPLLPP